MLVLDNHVEGSARLTAHVQELIGGQLARFSEQITRIETHLFNESGGSLGHHDKRCLLEARLAGLQPLSVTDQGAGPARRDHQTGRNRGGRSVSLASISRFS